MRKLIIIIGIVTTFSSTALATSGNQNKPLKFTPYRKLAFMPQMEFKRPDTSVSLVSIKGHDFVIKPVNKHALESLDFLISIRVPLN